MQLSIIGSGTLLPDDEHRSPGHLIEADELRLLLDCGSGVLHGLARDGKDWGAITHLAITHFHTDHFGDLPALLWAWTYGLPEEARRSRTLLGPRGLRRVLGSLADAHGDFILEPGGRALEVVEIRAGDSWSHASSDVVVTTHRTVHTPESLAYRVTSGGNAIGYTGDTGPDPRLGAFFRGSNVLISECSVPDTKRVDNHLSPPDVAGLAAAAQPGTLVLTHLYPDVRREGLEDVIRSEGYRGIVILAEDGLTVEL